jgi:hypothetical protein
MAGARESNDVLGCPCDGVSPSGVLIIKPYAAARWSGSGPFFNKALLHGQPYPVSSSCKDRHRSAELTKYVTAASAPNASLYRSVALIGAIFPGCVSGLPRLKNLADR